MVENNTLKNESPLKEYYNLTFDNSILNTIKENKGVLKELDYDNEYLIYKTPKVIKYLKNDGSIMNLSHKYYCYYIEVNQKNWVHSIKKIVWNFLMVFDERTWEIDEEKSKENLRAKVTYDLSQVEKKWKGWKIIDILSVKADPIDKWLNTYEVYYQKNNWNTEKKIIKADDKQISVMAAYFFKRNLKKYSWIKRIVKIDFAKTFWARMFFSTKKRKPLSLKDLQSFTYKLYKIYDSKPSTSFPIALKELIRTTTWNIRVTSIELYDITEKDGLPDPYNALKRLNQKDLDMWKHINFDEIYLSMAKLSEWWINMADIFFNLAELIERRVYLRRSVKNAMKKPIFTIAFLMWIAVFSVKSFAPILKEIYTGIWKEPPKMTMMFNDAIDWTFNNIFFVVLFIYIAFTAYNYFSQYTFYWKKAIHNIKLSIPLFWWFFKRSEFEILLSVASQLYAWSRWHWEILPVIQWTLVNYHIKWVVNTAAVNFNTFKVNPWIVFDKFPEYIDPRISSLFKPERMDTSKWGEVDQLRNNFKLDNDEFIQNLNWILSNVMLIIAWILLMWIIFATIIPMVQLATAV